MQEKDSPEYCSVKPKFPKKLYFAGIFLGGNDQIIFLPFHQTFTTIKKLDAYLKEVYEEFKSMGADAVIPPETIVIPMTLESLIPLKREYWEGEHQEFSRDERTHLFLQFVKTPQLHKVLVTPQYYDQKKDHFEFDAAMPMKISAGEKELEHFMYHSDYPVNESASHAAFYISEKSMRYNFETKELDVPNKQEVNNSGFSN